MALKKKKKVREEEEVVTKKKKKKVVEDEPKAKKKKKHKSVEYTVEDAVFNEIYGDDAADDEDEKPRKKKVKSKDKELKKPKKFDKEKELKKLKKNKSKLKDAQALLADIASKSKLSRTDMKDKVSIVGEHAESIHRLLEDDDVDGASSLIRKRMLQAMIDVIPFIEDNIRSSNGKTGSYHLKSLYECIHSILGEMQALKDRDAIARNFIVDILQPHSAGIANILIQELNNIMTDLRPLVRDDAKQELNQSLNAARSRMGAALSSQYTELRNVTLQFLQNNT